MAIPSLDQLKLLHNTVCKAVGDPRRIQLLYALHDHPQHVSSLARQLDLPPTTVSRHLSILRQGALVTTERNGTTIEYRLADPRIIDIIGQMRQLLHDTLKHQSTLFPGESQ